MTFTDFFDSERAGGFALVLCTVLALVLANTAMGPAWLGLWQTVLGPLSLQQWVNDGLMAIFFLLVGLELERELYVGELSDARAALLPIIAAGGGVAVPAALHFWLNAGTPSQPGAGIPMATDIAFALAALSTLGSRVPTALKVFLTALAVIDDLIAVVVIALAYNSGISGLHLLAAGGVLAAMIAMNRLGIQALAPYLVSGGFLWLSLLGSGIHPTLSGIALAFAIPFRPRSGDRLSPSAAVERRLHRPVAFFVLPAFALANAGVALPAGAGTLIEPNALGILLGLIVGKPVGITLACVLAVAAGISRPAALRWRHIVGGGMLAGIGFTMSTFVAILAFPDDPQLVDQSKLAILAGSVCSAILGISWLSITMRRATLDRPAIS